jgi:lipoprotein-anchoring transpeptidase ErfK/SrfK
VNKKLLIIIPTLIALVIAGALVLNIKKCRISLPVAGSNLSQAAPLINQVKELEAKGNLVEARSVYQKLVSDFSNSPEVMSWQKRLEELNIKLLFSAVITPKSVLYEIKPGDTLTKIAKEHKTTVELIKRSNNLSGDAISPGKKIKVWTAAFTIFVDKSQNSLYLKTDEDIFKAYVVATGRDNCTPVGTFKIANKLINPTWFKDNEVIPAGNPRNILGTRWMGFDTAPNYGIHGTTEPQSIGKQSTSGCVRMLNSDVEELYSIVPVGTEVTIVD